MYFYFQGRPVTRRHLGGWARSCAFTNRTPATLVDITHRRKRRDDRCERRNSRCERRGGEREHLQWCSLSDTRIDIGTVIATDTDTKHAVAPCVAHITIVTVVLSRHVLLRRRFGGVYASTVDHRAIDGVISVIVFGSVVYGPSVINLTARLPLTAVLDIDRIDRDTRCMTH